MSAKYSTSGSDTWIVDVMENDSVMTSAEAESEEEAMTIARTAASAFYGSRTAMFEYAVYPFIRRRPEQGDGSRRMRPNTDRGEWRRDWSGLKGSQFASDRQSK
jgi:hypothetical protein